MPKFSGAALVLLLTLPASVRADQPSPGSDPGFCESLRTINATRNKIWVTVYDAAKLRHLDYGWVEPCTVRVWKSGGYACGSYYHVRAEVKPYDVSKGNVYDTNVEWNPQGLNYGSWVVTLRRGKDNYYWEHGNTAGCTPTGVTACCKAGEPQPQGAPEYAPPPPRAPEKVDFTFDNQTPAFAQVTIYNPILKDRPTIHEECVEPKTAKTWNLYGMFDYRVRAIPHRRGCDDGEPLKGHVGEAKTKDGKAAAVFEYDAKTRAYGFAR